MATYQLGKTGAEIDEALSLAVQHEDSKANIDGAYENFTAGNAEQLISSVKVNNKVPYNFRTSGGSIDIGNRKNEKIVGGTLVWNQLVQNGNFANNNNWATDSSSNLTIADNKATIHKDSSTGATTALNQSVAEYIVGHKYLIFATVQSTNGRISIIPSGATADGQSGYAQYPSKTNLMYLWTCPANVYGHSFLIRGYTGGGITSAIDFTVENVMIFDLTRLFGSAIADHIASVEQANAGAGAALFKSLFPKSYYAYNAGELMSVKTSKNVTVGFNQFDKSAATNDNGLKWVDGSLFAENKSVTSDYIRAVDATYYTNYKAGCFAYDENKQYIGALSNNGWVKSTGNITNMHNVSGAYYIRFWFRSSANDGADLTSADLNVNLSWDGERDGEYEEYAKHEYALDSNLELRGIPKLDANDDLYYDGDEYASDGTVTRYYGTRAYQSGDESLDNAITDGTNTVYKLETPTTESADAYTNPMIIDDFGTEEFVDTRDVAIPAGHETEYQNNLRAKLEMSPDSPDGNGDYIVRQTNGINSYVPLVIPAELPTTPTTDGTYHLKLVIADGTATLSWEAQS